MPWRCAIFKRDVNCFFHLVRRFWNHVLICTSVKLSDFESSIRLLTLRYLSSLNSFSSFSNCFTLYAWRGLRSMPGLRDRFPNNFGPNYTNMHTNQKSKFFFRCLFAALLKDTVDNWFWFLWPLSEIYKITLNVAHYIFINVNRFL